MATVDKTVGGTVIQEYIAHTTSVQRSLDAHARIIFAKAQANLMAVRADPGYTGNTNAELSIEKGDIDRYIVLHDPLDGTSPGAAASIEYGHYMGKRGLSNRPSIEGKFVLHDAAGIDRSGPHQ